MIQEEGQFPPRAASEVGRADENEDGTRERRARPLVLSYQRRPYAAETAVPPPLPTVLLPGGLLAGRARMARTNSIMDLAKNLKIDSVSRLQSKPPLRVAPEQPVAEAVALMREHNIGCVLVCRDEQLLGLFTERDLLRRVLAAGKPLTAPVGDCMTPDPVTVHPKEPIGAAIRRMEEGGYRHLPVVDEAGRAVGVLSVKRIVHYLVEHYSPTVYNQPPDPSSVPHTAEGA